MTYQERQKQGDLQRKNAANSAARDVGEIPEIANPRERENAKWDLKYDLERYHAEKFSLGWCNDHLQLIKFVQNAFLTDMQLLVAVAMSRGSGKTTICRAGVEWAVRHGHLRWPILIEADDDAYQKQMKAFHVTFRTKQLLAEDFPETVWVIQQMSTSQAAPNMTCMGEPMNMVWKTKEIVLPTNYASLDPRVIGAKSEGRTASGVISGGGITGSVRGAQYTLPTGEVLRPDGFIINDPQTRESAGSPKQIKDRIDIISADLLGMGGPGKPMSGVMTMTVIAKSDVADRVLGPEFPQWRSIRGKWLIKWPTNMDGWQSYGVLLRRKLAEMEVNADDSGDEITNELAEVNEFYESNRECRYGLGWHKPGLDHGAKVYWEARIDPPYLSSLQTFMSWWLISPEAAMAEGNNDPVDPHSPTDIVYCSREDILAKLSSLERYECPDDAVELVAKIDVQMDMLIYSVTAVCPGFRRYVVDYGPFPEQGREYWTKATISKRLSDHWSSPKEAWVEGLKTLTAILKQTEWTKTSGQRMHITFGDVDAAWGESTDAVFQFCRENGEGIWYPSFGVGITAGKNDINHGSEQKAWQKRHTDWGPHWNRKPDHDRGIDKYSFNAYFFQSLVHIGIATPEQEDGSLQFFQGDHQLLADHLRANYPEQTEGRGRKVTEWKGRPGHDDDLFDCISANGMGASARKLDIPGMEGFGRKQSRSRKSSFGRKNLTGR